MKIAAAFFFNHDELLCVGIKTLNHSKQVLNFHSLVFAGFHAFLVVCFVFIVLHFYMFNCATLPKVNPLTLLSKCLVYVSVDFVFVCVCSEGSNSNEDFDLGGVSQQITRACH